MFPRFSTSVISSCFVIIFFFFYWCGVHRDLHSFPTRRSSDLGFVLPIAHFAIRIRRRQGNVPLCWIGGERRSEEHTSELQSHSDLVCRLLLEKKNQTSKV